MLRLYSNNDQPHDYILCLTFELMDDFFVYYISTLKHIKVSISSISNAQSMNDIITLTCEFATFENENIATDGHITTTNMDETGYS